MRMWNWHGSGPEGGRRWSDHDRHRHPDIRFQLTGEDGNAFMIIGLVQRALRDAGVSEEEVSRFCAEATSRYYTYVLATCMRWVDVR